MSSGAEEHVEVRCATVADAGAIARLLYDFNREFGDPTPPPEALADRVRLVVGSGESMVLLAGAGPDGLALLRFRPAIWSAGTECYLAELYVVPERRGRGIGRALMNESIAQARLRGADNMDLGTGESDVAARALYESLGFTNREGGSAGPAMLYYELALADDGASGA